MSKEIVKDRIFLCHPSEEIPYGEELSSLYEDLVNTLRQHKHGVGLSAVQIGVHKRAFVIKMKNGDFYFFANPKITKKRDIQESTEGCLSVPDVVKVIFRPRLVTIKGFDENWNPIKIKLHDFEAAIACHEYDHLDGILIDF